LPCQEAESYLLNKILYGLFKKYQIKLVKPNFSSLKHIFKFDYSFEKDLKSKIEIEEIKYNYFELILIKIFRKLLIKLFYDSNHIDLVSYFWQQKVIKYLKNKKNLDYTILSWSNPLANHKAVLEIQKKINIKWIAYISDPISDNPYSYKKNFYLKKIDSHIEKKILNRANKVIVTSKNYQNKIISNNVNNINKLVYVPHSFNKFEPSINNNSISINLDFDYINLLHLGSLYGLRNPITFINLLSNLSLFESKLRVYFVGFIEKKIFLSLKNYKSYFNKSIFFIDPISYLDSLKLFNNFDVLINIDGPNDKGLFLPSKFIDYLSSKKPIYSLTSKNSEVDRISKDLNLRCSYYSDLPNVTNPSLSKFFLESKKYQLNNKYRSLRDAYSLNNQSLKFSNIIDNLSN